MKSTLFLLLFFTVSHVYSQSYEVKCCMSPEHELLLLGVDINKEFDFLSTNNIEKQVLAYDQQRQKKYQYFDGRVSEVYYSYTDEITKCIYLGVDYNVFRFAKPYLDLTLKDSLVTEGIVEYNKLSKTTDEYSRIVGCISNIIDKEDLYIMLSYCKRNNYKIFFSQNKAEPLELYISIGLEQNISKLKSIVLLASKDIQNMKITICVDCMKKKKKKKKKKNVIVYQDTIKNQTLGY